MVAENPQQQYANWYYQHQQHQQQQYFAETSCAAESSMQLWPTYAQPTYLQYQQHHAAAYQQQQMQFAVAAQNQQQQQSIGWGNEEAHHHNKPNSGEPSPVNTCSSGEISCPGTPASIAEDARINANKSPFEWMKKSNYQPSPGKTRTKEKYRIVYTEHQRLELEKEFYSSRYITTMRKAELSNAVNLSERQIKIWFQNRRAKERKQTKKCSDPAEPQQQQQQQHDIKPILDAHGVAHAPPTSAVPPLIGMANLSLGHTSMNGLTSDLQPSAPLSSALMAHHHHPRLNAAVAAAAHHFQQPSMGSWGDSSHGL